MSSQLQLGLDLLRATFAPVRRPLIRNACSCATPQEFDAETYGLPTDPEERAKTPIMMYCTGGIRCEYFSAKLREQGFEKVYNCLLYTSPSPRDS